MQLLKGAALIIFCCAAMVKAAAQDLQLMLPGGTAYTFRGAGKDSILITGADQGCYAKNQLQLNQARLQLSDNRSNFTLGDQKFALRRYQDNWQILRRKQKLFSVSVRPGADKQTILLEQTLYHSGDSSAPNDMIAIAAALIIRDRLLDDAANGKIIDPLLLGVLSAMAITR